MYNSNLNESNRYTPALIAAGEQRFNIPLYQRLFEWEEPQVEQLLNDLWGAYTKSPEKPYYIGMLTAIHNRKDAKLDLVDGQQRFTVLLLLAIVLRNYGDEAEWDKFIGDKDNLRLSFFARDKDTSYIQSLLGTTVTDENAKMDNARQKMKEFLDEKKKTDEQRKGFSSFVFNNLSFFISELPENYGLSDLNRYFETMNSTGRNLESYEIIKVKLLQKIDDDEKREQYTAIWNAVEEMDKDIIREKDNEDVGARKGRWLSAFQAINGWEFCNDAKVSSGKAADDISIEKIQPKQEKPDNRVKNKLNDTCSILTFSEFLLQVLYLSLNKEERGNVVTTKFFDVHKSLATFDEYLLNDEKVKPEQFVLNLLKYRLLFDYYIIQVKEDNGSTNYDLLFKSGEEDKSLLMYESMLYVSSGSTTIYRWLCPLLEYLSGVCHKDITVAEVLRKLKAIDDERYESEQEIDNERNKLPNLEELTYGKIDRYWFWRLDYYLWEQRTELFKDNKEALDVANKYTFRRNRSIEHIAPQHPNQDSFFTWEDDKGNILEMERMIMNSFGNLSMISSGLNSSLSNSTFEEKRLRIQQYCNKQRDDSSVESLKMLLFYIGLDKDTSDLELIKAHIKAHGEAMYKVLKDSFGVIR